MTDTSKDPNKVMLKGPSTPTGSISGRVLASSASAPLSGATVSAVVGGATVQTTTDDKGFWFLQGLPGESQVQVNVSKTGFATLSTPAFVPSHLRGLPVSNGNGFTGQWILVQLNGTVSFQVFAADGSPAKGVKGTLEVWPTTLLIDGSSFRGIPLPFSNQTPLRVTATANDSGVLTFTGVPDPANLYALTDIFENILGRTDYQLTVADLDQNGDGIPDSAGLTQDFPPISLFVGASTAVQMLPAQATSAGVFQLLSSTVPSLAGGNAAPMANLLKGTDAITLIFTHQIQPGSLLVRVTDEFGTTLENTTTAIQGQVVTVTLPSGLTQGQEYNIALHAISRQTGEQIDTTGYFFVGDPTAPLTPSLGTVVFHDGSNGNLKDSMLNPGENVDVVFNEPVGYFGSAGGTLPIGYINFDLNGSGKIGDAFGEKGFSGDGFPVYPNEPTAEPNTRFVLLPSNHSTRWSINYFSGPKIPPSTEFDIAFDRLKDPNGGVQTIWGAPLQTTFNRLLTQTTP